MLNLQRVYLALIVDDLRRQRQQLLLELRHGHLRDRELVPHVMQVALERLALVLDRIRPIVEPLSLRLFLHDVRLVALILMPLQCHLLGELCPLLLVIQRSLGR